MLPTTDFTPVFPDVRDENVAVQQAEAGAKVLRRRLCYGDLSLEGVHVAVGDLGRDQHVRYPMLRAGLEIRAVQRILALVVVMRAPPGERFARGGAAVSPLIFVVVVIKLVRHCLITVLCGPVSALLFRVGLSHAGLPSS